MAKIGRNNPCPCGSGKKYKRCHGSIEHLSRIQQVMAHADRMRGRAEADHVQRQRQQGLGKPIISTEANGYRVVAVKNRLHYSDKWKTFHDFLVNYLPSVLGREWGNAQLAKPADQRHPILTWYQMLCEQQRITIMEPGTVSSATMTGAVAAYMYLAYDLYALEHNVELQAALVARLRNHDKFTGARYEVYIAAIFIRAGFDLEFENEADGTTTHCEFTATHRRTGRKFSVDAKRREGNRPRIGRLFNDALSKRANHDRVIFIDINMRDDLTGNEEPSFLQKALRRLREFEGMLLNDIPRPSAYVFATNTPWAHYLDQPVPRCTALAEGFQIPDFKGGVHARSFRHAIEAREAHIEMHELIQSIKDHSSIPSTFDGTMSEFAFDSRTTRLIVGERYMVPDADGTEHSAELECGIVVENKRTAMCIMKLEDGKRLIHHIPLSDAELNAWRRHPDTFFGVVGQRTTRAENPLDLYDFLMNSYRDTPKEKLLEFLASAPDIVDLMRLDQPKLASIYSERMASSIIAASGNAQTAAPSADLSRPEAESRTG
jgi:hypothetical protein